MSILSLDITISLVSDDILDITTNVDVKDDDVMTLSTTQPTTETYTMNNNQSVMDPETTDVVIIQTAKHLKLLNEIISLF